MGREIAANYLLSLPILPEVRVSDKDGNMTISAITMTMPRVVCPYTHTVHTQPHISYLRYYSNIDPRSV